MSPLPQQKKSPEELAALRESLGIPESPPNPPTPPTTEFTSPENPPPTEPEPPAPLAEPEPSPEPEPDTEPTPTTPPSAPHSLRKSAGLIVDYPKGQTSHGDTNSIPARRRTERELMELRRAALTSPNPTTVVTKKIASPLTLLIFYGIAILGLSLGLIGFAASQVSPIDLPFHFLRDWVKSDLFIHQLFAIFATTAALMLLCAAWLAACRPISRHHAGFLLLFAILILSFASVFCYF